MVSSTHELPSLVAAHDRGAISTGEPGRVRRFTRDLRRSKQAMLGLCIVGVLVVVAAGATAFAPTDPGKPVLTDTLLSPSISHPFGTDELGRDILGRIIHGARVSLMVAGIAVGISLFIGAPIGMVAGYWQGALGSVLMRIMDAVQAFPGCFSRSRSPRRWVPASPTP